MENLQAANRHKQQRPYLKTTSVMTHCVWQDLNVSGFSKESKDAREKRTERPKPPALRAPEAPRRLPAPPPRPRLTQNACYEQPLVPRRCHGDPSPSAAIRARLMHCSDPAGWKREPRRQVPGSSPPPPTPARAQVQRREEGLGLSVGGGWTEDGRGFPARQPPLVQLGSTIPPVSQPRSCWRLRRVGMWDCTERGGRRQAAVTYTGEVPRERPESPPAPRPAARRAETRGGRAAADEPPPGRPPLRAPGSQPHPSAPSDPSHATPTSPTHLGAPPSGNPRAAAPVPDQTGVPELASPPSQAPSPGKTSWTPQFGGQKEREVFTLLRTLARDSVWSGVCGVPRTGWWCPYDKADLHQGGPSRDLAGVEGASSAPGSPNGGTVKRAPLCESRGVPFGAGGRPVWLRGSLTRAVPRLGCALWPIR
ncbi:basic proline-rich protein-like [Phocoena sinus]|uniref:basic proline-rich protein-like n=1 Tax=Phocoena sinus TaxID=42100 RepID=UPI0013C4844C|nr:basic proline-rich protein-like [Phocoena sinus]